MDTLQDINTELLEACEIILEWAGEQGDQNYMPWEPPWYDELKTAIHKAKGTQP